MAQQKFDVKYFLAGVAGGSVSSCVLHPLDLIKIRLSVSDGSSARPKYNNILHLTKSVLKQRGIRGMYSGVTPSVVGAGLSWGFYFFFYYNIKSYLTGHDKEKQLSTFDSLACGCLSGSMTLVMTNPIWIAKTRMCLMYETSSTVQYRGILHTISQLIKENGVRGLYKGMVPGLLGTSHGAIQFLVYERLKHWNRKRKNMKPDDKIGTFDVLSMSATSKLIAASSTYPYQVVRSRLQDQHRSYNGVFDVIKSTWKNESWRGFYKGLGPSLMRVIPACCITFYTYETTLYYLTAYNKQQAMNR